jgi:hypothetical protein
MSECDSMRVWSVRNRKRMGEYRVRTGFRLCSMDRRRSLGCIADQDVANVPGRLRHASGYREGVRTIDARACVRYLTDVKRSGASCSEFEGNAHRKGCESSKMRRPGTNGYGAYQAPCPCSTHKLLPSLSPSIPPTPPPSRRSKVNPI